MKGHHSAPESLHETVLQPFCYHFPSTLFFKVCLVSRNLLPRHFCFFGTSNLTSTLTTVTAILVAINLDQAVADLHSKTLSLMHGKQM